MANGNGNGHAKKNGNGKAKSIDPSRIEAMVGLGLNLDEIARNIGMSAQYLGQLRKNDPVLAEAFANGKAKAKLAILNKAYSIAQGNPAPAGTVTMLMFILKAQHGWRDRDSAFQYRDPLEEATKIRQAVQLLDRSMGITDGEQMAGQESVLDGETNGEGVAGGSGGGENGSGPVADRPAIQGSEGSGKADGA